MDETLKNTLLWRGRNASQVMDADEAAAADGYCRGYIDFLNAAKTERETVRQAVSLAEAAGFVPWESFGKLRGIKSGDKLCLNQRGKALILFVAGKRPLEEGLSIAAAHVDSPRLDLKLRPLYEETGAAFFDTHYYGEIKAYQWTGIPLALHGHVIRADGRAIDVCIGEDQDDPVLFIADLLPHLSKKQMKRRGADLIHADDLDIIAGLRSCPGESEAGAVKLNILRILYEKYGITEADLISAELSAVPAFPARDLGLDRSMVGGYGQDDRVCVYAALSALFSLGEVPSHSICVILADKEETGSDGMTGMRSRFFENSIGAIAEAAGENPREALHNSLCISADVNAAYYHLYADVLDPRGDARLNQGMVLFRYWGHGGKEHTNNAEAETTAALRKILDDAGVLWQTAEGGRVDAEDSGTLSRFLANLDIPTIDVGVPLLSMHSPFEAASKTDIYMARRGFAAFFAR
ncbi:MAG: aminopeptidase [Treponema sp.]|jgi:aspartyl aminopeptidase|nr:aminopeptidase [Treponema sp.]